MRGLSLGQAVFAATMVGVGVLGLTRSDLTTIWPPIPALVPGREALADLCALISIGAGLGLLWGRTAAVAARLLLVALLLCFVLLRLPHIVIAPAVQDSWSSSGETAVVVAAAWALYARLPTGWDRRRLGFATGEMGQRLARRLYGAALIPFGVAHLVLARQTAVLVPGWLPGHLGWAYFTGAAYIVAGAALILGLCIRAAATLAAVQIGLFTLLVWGPIVAAGGKNAFVLSETVISIALTAAAWVVAETTSDAAWLALREPRPAREYPVTAH